MFGIIFCVLSMVLGLIEFMNGNIYNAFLLMFVSAIYYIGYALCSKTAFFIKVLKAATNVISSSKDKKKEDNKTTDDEVEDFLK